MRRRIFKLETTSRYLARLIALNPASIIGLAYSIALRYNTNKESGFYAAKSRKTFVQYDVMPSVEEST